MNECVFVGNFTNDPILERMYDDTVSVLNFRVAVHRKFKAGSGQSKQETSFLDMEVFDSGAETIARNFKKGDQILVKACARNSKNGKVKFRVNTFYPMKQKGEENGGE